MKWRDKLGLKREVQECLVERAAFSSTRLDDLRNQISQSKHLQSLPDLSIFASGSYGRLEAGRHSDIDLFFLCNKRPSEYAGLNISKIQMMSEIIDIARAMHFPEFSNDGEFLSVLFVPEILDNLGGRSDDYANHFTARLLLLLEGRPLTNAAAFQTATENIIESYFRDYPHHPEDFRPTFLTNDIIRFWKTLCLNYENRRNALGSNREVDSARRRKQQIKNYKLKFSRALTCFATIGILSTFDTSVEPKDVADLCELAPIDRLAQIADRRPKAKTAVKDAIALYSSFLRTTAKSPDELAAYFADEKNRTNAFKEAALFGDRMFDMLTRIDMNQRKVRYLVI
ncbi:MULTISPECIES: nucleotidyltransferase domain-containing protein [unclassified Bradyrhizobium]|uniref:nucleotidyltransferase domain-containing protein n=1 Tax=unclassified Bradyrhizobium TaxID=2631580 RepID=UPI0028EADF6A|nr:MULTISPECIES: nucleotidyltransferase domain-containing protein [unclassified Bradyrhizobium]